jgi:hypothetical protein
MFKGIHDWPAEKSCHYRSACRISSATGPDGFEGLVRNLLEQWTGLAFRLIRSDSV